MNTNAITFAAKAKGSFALLRRVRAIANRYSFTPAKMDQALRLFAQTLGQFDCGASFPITAIALKRNSRTIAKYLDQNIEFAVHGYTHIDYSQLAPEEQLAHLHRARETFAELGIAAVGFRSPYLRRDPHLYAAIEAAGFSYVSNQPIFWNVLDLADLDPSASTSYERAIHFYAPWHADERPALPRLDNQLVEIPVLLPDDEMLVDRLGSVNNGLVGKAWQRILSQTYERGELFTIQLHPERIANCLAGLSDVLSQAREQSPSVWMARLDEIAAWWQARAAATTEITETGDGKLRLEVIGPKGTTVLARGIQVDAPTVPWANGYQQAQTATLTIQAPCRPFIGLPPEAPPKLIDFLRQQGYILEISPESHRYAYYLAQTQFTAEHERHLLAQIEQTDRPLVRLGRWPNGARSALAVTGDIDALTLWDYGLRFLGR